MSWLKSTKQCRRNSAALKVFLRLTYGHMKLNEERKKDAEKDDSNISAILYKGKDREKNEVHDNCFPFVWNFWAFGLVVW